MTAAHDRGARREREAAKVLGGERVHRARGERAPDLHPIRLPSGELLGPEVKTRRRLPRLLMKALNQARGYFGPSVVPLAVVSALGGVALAVLPLRDFARLVGLEVGALPAPRRPSRKRRAPKQLDLLLIDDDGPRCPR